MTVCAVSVVVPLFRNRGTVTELAARVRRALETGLAEGRVGPGFELLFVDDASPDDTLEAAVDVARDDPAVGVLALARNQGQQRAVLVGLEEAQGEWSVSLDGDLQDPPEAIPRLLAEARRGPWDAVFAGRRGRYEPFPRLLTSRLFKTALSWAANVPRDAGMFVAMSRRMRQGIRRYETPRPFLVAMIGLTGLPATSIPVRREPRLDGRSTYTGPMRLSVGVSALAWAVSWRCGWRPRVRPAGLEVAVRARFGVCSRSRAGAP